MMDGRYGIGLAMMITTSAAAAAVLALVFLGAVRLARDLSTGERREGPQR
jgi:hypothetical protein